MEKYDTTPKIKTTNLSRKAQDIFKDSLGMSSTYKSPKVQIKSKKLISPDQVSASFAASQSLDVETDSTSSKEIFKNNEKKENNSVSSSPALQLKMSSTYKSPTVQITSKKSITTDQVSASFAESQSLDVQTDSTSSKEIFENNEKKENISVSSSPLRLKIKLTSKIGESQASNSSSKTIRMASESSNSQSRRKVRKSKGTKRNRRPSGTTSKVFEVKCPPGPPRSAGPATSSNSVKSSTSSKDKSDFKTLVRNMQALHKRKHPESER